MRALAAYLALALTVSLIAFGGSVLVNFLFERVGL